jgi:hypothetical protein
MEPEEELTPKENTPEKQESETLNGESAEMKPEEENTTTGASQPAEPVEEKPASGAMPRMQVGQPHPKKSFGAKVLPWVIVALLFYIGGLATVYFALYQPKVEALKTAVAEESAQADAAADEDAAKIIELTNDYNQALKQYQDAQSELDLTRAELDGAKATIADQSAQIEKLNTENLAYKFLVDVSTARTALELEDTATARQAINFAKMDLDALKKTNLTTDVLAGLAEKLNDASSNLTLTGMDKARDALDTLYTNMLSLIQNLP